MRGSSQATPLQGRLLSVADLPAGWSAVPVNPKITSTSPCLSSVSASPTGLTHATAAFVEGTSIPAFAEALTSGPQAQQQWRSLNQALARCRTATIAIAGDKDGVTIQPRLVLITGYGGTMESWDRRFVDALAEHHRVVIFDNAGIGGTRALPGPLSIDAMANQTSALIGTLGLGRPDVLGWSMGSMIAQALAVLHPGQVNRLVLCASWPGNGQAVPPSQQTLNADTTGDLFPADQTAAQDTYLASISSYPAVPAVPAAIAAAQEHAIDQWWADRDPAGIKDATIAVPTLITDGTADLLDPLANSHTLASLIHGAQLTLYPDAGHGFLFQDQTALIPRIESFLGLD
jgi:pimeloyl-ACP methyl ester carboxylesterase